MTQAELARKTDIRPNTINALYHEYIKYISVEDLGRYAKCWTARLAICLSMLRKRKRESDESHSLFLVLKNIFKIQKSVDILV